MNCNNGIWRKLMQTVCVCVCVCVCMISYRRKVDGGGRRFLQECVSEGVYSKTGETHLYTHTHHMMSLPQVWSLQVISFSIQSVEVCNVKFVELNRVVCRVEYSSL